MLQISAADLTEKQAAFVSEYVSSGNASEAARAAGYEHREMGYQALRSQAVQRAILDHQQRRVRIEGATLGINALISLVKDAKSEAVKLQAAKYLIDAAGLGAKDSDKGKDKPLAEMSEAELMKTIERLKSAVAEPSHPETGRMPPPGPGETQIDQ